MSPPVPHLAAAAADVLSVLEAARIPACLIVRRQGARLNVEFVRRWGREFAELKEDPDLLHPFEAALAEAGRA